MMEAQTSLDALMDALNMRNHQVSSDSLSSVAVTPKPFAKPVLRAAYKDVGAQADPLRPAGLVHPAPEPLEVCVVPRVASTLGAVPVLKARVRSASKKLRKARSSVTTSGTQVTRGGLGQPDTRRDAEAARCAGYTARSQLPQELPRPFSRPTERSSSGPTRSNPGSPARPSEGSASLPESSRLSPGLVSPSREQPLSTQGQSRSDDGPSRLVRESSRLDEEPSRSGKGSPRPSSRPPRPSRSSTTSSQEPVVAMVRCEVDPRMLPRRWVTADTTEEMSTLIKWLDDGRRGNCRRCGFVGLRKRALIHARQHFTHYYCSCGYRSCS
jgi:hypothetical protein